MRWGGRCRAGGREQVGGGWAAGGRRVGVMWAAGRSKVGGPVRSPSKWASHVARLPESARLASSCDDVKNSGTIVHGIPAVRSVVGGEGMASGPEPLAHPRREEADRTRAN